MAQPGDIRWTGHTSHISVMDITGWPVGNLDFRYAAEVFTIHIYPISQVWRAKQLPQVNFEVVGYTIPRVKGDSWSLSAILRTEIIGDWHCLDILQESDRNSHVRHGMLEAFWDALEEKINPPLAITQPNKRLARISIGAHLRHCVEMAYIRAREHEQYLAVERLAHA